MQLSQTFLIDMENKIYDKMYHSYLSKEVEIPKIDRDKLYLLLSILKSRDLHPEQLETYASTVMFIQTALDTHDLVKNDDEYMPLKKRQLTVLAGDFYSGLYYHSLSGISNIKLIQYLAEGIKAVNEYKLRVYNREVMTFEDFMKSMQQVETAIYQKLANYFRCGLSETLSTHWLHIVQILKEKERYIRYIIDNRLIPAPSNDFHKNNESANELINHYIDKMYDEMQDRIGDITAVETFFLRIDEYIEKAGKENTGLTL